MRDGASEDVRSPCAAADGARAGSVFRLESALAVLRERGLRLTPLKRAVLETFDGGECGLTAEEIGGRIGVGADLSPLYRCLASLEQAGILTHFYVTGGSRRYDPADEFGSHHHHLVCLNCSGVARVEGCALSGAISAEAAALGYVVRDHEVVLKGLCPECSDEPGTPGA